ncbi:LOW QUALITY PROTEIN: protein PAXX [Pezoporus flaviventris]|uniref:LOW QUALITY PROTEIN: protein PAXX n=1 Tax=Pezoporus flaviventris TaxID=889875 RepID=UPI002AB2063C|nr:LOW QUALITY PROTEIN: protein PAXX [Pezoporus flaviventris]
MAEPAGPFHRLQAGSCRYLCLRARRQRLVSAGAGPGPRGGWGAPAQPEPLSPQRDRCAGGVGWGARRPPVAGLPVPAGGALREAQVRAAERGDRPRLRAPLTPDRPGREALGRGAASLSPGEARGTLRLQGDAPCSALDLRPLPAGEARSQLRALLFGMAGRIEGLERRLSGGSRGDAAAFFLVGCLVPKAGQDLHFITSGGRAPVWDQCCVPVRKHNLVPVAPSSGRGDSPYRVVETLASSCSPKKNTAQNQQQFLPDPKPWKNRGAGSDLPARRKIPGESLINPGFKSKKAPSGVDFEDS